MIALDKKKPTAEEELTKKISDDVKHRLRSKREGKEIMFGMVVNNRTYSSGSGLGSVS